MELNHASELPPNPGGGVAEADVAFRLHIVTPEMDPVPAVPDDVLLDDRVSDDALIAAMAAGETAALGALYDRYASPIFALLMRIVRERGAAEDLLQEAFLRAWQQAHHFDEARGSVRCWLYSMAHNLALNELRRQRRRPQAQMPASSDDAAGDDVLTALVAQDADPAADAWCALRDARVAEALAQLPSAQREVLELYAAGFSQSEIAARLGEPLGTIKSRMRRALCHLRVALPTVGVDAGWSGD